MSAAYTWASGQNRFDSTPKQQSADTLREFAAAVLARRAKDKASAGYITAAFGGDGRRCAANVLPRAWLALDVDGIDADALVEWRLFQTRWRGFGWPTASSTPEAPRERAIIELSEPVDRAQGIGIGALILRDVAENFGAAVRLDPCGFRGEQPAFLAPVGVRPFYLLGDPIDVPVWLAQAPPTPPLPPPAMGMAADLADARMRSIVEQLGDAGLLRMLLPNERGYAMHCPWERLHTSSDCPSSTALLFPAESNGWRGGFSCLHSHCVGRSLRDVVTLLEQVAKVAA
jgi:hypothetical protein